MSSKPRNLDQLAYARLLAGTPDPKPVEQVEDEDETKAEAPVTGIEQPDPHEDPAPLAAEPEVNAYGFTADEMEQIRREAREKVAKELAAANAVKRKEKMTQALAAELLVQRHAAGLTDYRDDLVPVLIDVAPFTDKIVIDGTMYMHQCWYTVDRRKADTIREICARSWDSEDRAGSPNRKFYRNVAGTMRPMEHEPRSVDGSHFSLGGAQINAKTGAIAGAGAGRLQ